MRVTRRCRPDSRERGLLEMTLSRSGAEVIFDGDKRHVTALQWVDGILVIARSGSITLWAPEGSTDVKWSGVRRLVLPQMGNWAGANPYGECVGISQISSEIITIVLAGHLYYLITDLSTAPKVIASSEAMTLSLYSRRICMDTVEVPLFVAPGEMDGKGRMMTARTAGWSGVGEGGLVSWYGEMFNNHDLDTTTEGQKHHFWHVADMGGLIAGRLPLGPALQSLLLAPPSLAQISPLKVLLPYMLRIIAALDQTGALAEVGKVLSAELETPHAHPASDESDGSTLQRGLWEGEGANATRLIYSLARFCETRASQAKSGTAPTSPGPAFGAMAATALASIRQLVDQRLSDWMSTLELSSIRGDDLRFAVHVAKAHPSTALTAMLDAAHAQEAREGGSATDRCPACGTAIEDDGGEIGVCAKGHEWNRCTVTGYLLLNASYRLCSMCGAAALLPTCHKDPAKPVLRLSGRNQDNQRFERSTYNVKVKRVEDSEAGVAHGRQGRPEQKKQDGQDEQQAKVQDGQDGHEGWLMDEALEAAIGCVLCGGRWVRAT